MSHGGAGGNGATTLREGFDQITRRQGAKCALITALISRLTVTGGIEQSTSVTTAAANESLRYRSFDARKSLMMGQFASRDVHSKSGQFFWRTNFDVRICHISNLSLG
jgi:hypothetical protein